MFKQILVLFVTPVFLFAGMVSSVHAYGPPASDTDQARHAGLVSTADYIQQTDAAQMRDAVTEHLMRDDVQAQMVELGVDVDDVEARVAAMSDAEVMQLHADIEQMPAGAAISDTTLILLIILIILLV
ncbi:MAG: PA2779 family protein [Gammaproteobacteria bacterium]|nr:PA2779 family protein [Gammaproteobacteria bacterium]